MSDERIPGDKRAIRMPVSSCPDCGEPLDGAYAIGLAQPPDPGDFSICIYCAMPLVFDDELRLVAPDAATALEMKRNTTFTSTLFAVRARIARDAAGVGKRIMNERINMVDGGQPPTMPSDYLSKRFRDAATRPTEPPEPET